MKKLFLILIFAGLIFPFISLAGEYQIINNAGNAQEIHYEGIVPCGKSFPVPGEDCEVQFPCKLCHFFVMFDGIIDFVLINIIVPIAVLMIVVGGVMFLFAGANPNLVAKGKSIMTSVVIGLIIIFGAWLFISFFLSFLNVVEWTGLDEWFTINCPIDIGGWSCPPTP